MRHILLLLTVFLRGRPCVAGGSFPCADDEYVSASWHPPLEPDCRSCYECSIGQTCRQRGGCFNCSAGEYDADGVPTRACEKCPEGKTSTEAAAECTEVELSLWQSLWQSLPDEVQVGAIFGALSAGFLLYLVCDRCCPGTKECLTEKWSEYHGLNDDDDNDASAQLEPERKPESEPAAGVQRDEENPGETARLLPGDAA